MLREFSVKRIIAFVLIDWIGSLGMLYLSALLRIYLGSFSPPFADLLKFPQINGDWTWGVASADEVFSPQVFILVAVIWPFFFFVFSVYDGRRNQTLKAELLNVFLAVCVSTMTLAGMLYFTYRATSRLLFLIFLVLDLALLLSSRSMLSLYRRSHNGRRLTQRRAVLIVGAGQVGQNVVEQLRKYAWADVDLAGYVDDSQSKQGLTIGSVRVLGALDEIPAIVADHKIHDAVIALPLRAHAKLVATCQVLQALSVRVHVIPDLFALSFPSARLDGFGGIPVVHLGQPSIYGWRRFWKRAFDTLATTLGLVILSPLLLIIAIAVKLDSPGPVLFKQQRIGENGRPFTMLKFRSMRVGSDPGLHRAHVSRLIEQNLSLEQLNGTGQGSLKIADDSRVTRVGKFIRQTSVDELPQLVNVLRGEMSLVGPRPPISYEVELYKDWHKRRLEAIPGITGLWQVKGRNRVSFDEMVRLDLEYNERQSLWLDIQILIQTPMAVITGRGAG